MLNPGEFDVLVVGAGAAGLASAVTLAEDALRVALLEAKQRVGGRIYTVPAVQGGLPVELGAEFIHGLPPELFRLTGQAGLDCFELDGDSRCFRDGRLGDCQEMGEAFRILEELTEEFDGLEQAGSVATDLSFNEYLEQRKISGPAAVQAKNYVEGFNAADASRIGVLALAKQQRAEDAISGDRIFRIADGYSRLPEYLLKRFLDAGGEFFSSMPAVSLNWQRQSVELTAEPSRMKFRARAAVITLPLGVLHARRVNFQPVPEKIFLAADRLAMGFAKRVTFEFDSSLRPEIPSLDNLSFLFAPGEALPTWWTTMPRSSSLVTGWIGGPGAERSPASSLPEAALAALSKVLGVPFKELQSHLLRHHFHDWRADPHVLGAYTYVPKGAIHASDELSSPVEDTLFFAGEHTDTSGHWGTVHGALRSGYRAAKQVLASRSL